MEQEKKRRGRPRKVREPEAAEAVEVEAVPERMEVITEPNEIVNLDNKVDLTDIAKPAVEAPRMQVEAVEAEPSLAFREFIEPIVHTEKVHTERPVNDKERLSVLLKIKRYRDSFEVLKAWPVDDTASLPKLQAQLDEMKMAINSRNTHAIVKHLYILGVKGYELVGNRVGMKFQGLSDYLSKNPEVDSILKEIEIEYSLVGHSRPEQRLLLVTAASSMMVHSINCQSAVLQSIEKQKVDPGIVDQFKEL